jgi:hypothetical protein
VAISGEIAWLYFLSFNMWCVYVMVSTVIASIIESFQIHQDLAEANKRNEVQEAIEVLNDLWR